jgi:hypothetical protein
MCPIHHLSLSEIDNIPDIHLVITADPPLFIARELPRLQQKMSAIENANSNCSTYANAGVLLFRHSATSISIINDWSKSILDIPSHMIRVFPREQGALNCLVTHRYAQQILIVDSFTEINIDWFYRDISFIQHITSGMIQYRLERFRAFLLQIIYSSVYGDDEQRMEKNGIHYDSFRSYVPQYPSIRFSDIGSDDSGGSSNKLVIQENDTALDVILKCKRMQHSVNYRTFHKLIKFKEIRFGMEQLRKSKN